MSVTNCILTGFPYRNAATPLSPTLSGANTLLAMCWAKLSATDTGTAYQFLCTDKDVADPTASLNIGVHSTNTLWTRIDTTVATGVVDDTTNSGIAALFGVWAHFAIVLEGPSDGTTKAWRTYINGAIWDSGTLTSQSGTSLYNGLYVGTGETADGKSGIKYAYVALAEVASLAAADAIVVSAQTNDPKNISGITHCWPLVSDYHADINGPALGTFGGVLFDGADNPVFAAAASSRPLFLPNPAVQHMLVR
jgi:hypothetical protein